MCFISSEVTAKRASGKDLLRLSSHTPPPAGKSISTRPFPRTPQNTPPCRRSASPNQAPEPYLSDTCHLVPLGGHAVNEIGVSAAADPVHRFRAVSGRAVVSVRGAV